MKKYTFFVTSALSVVLLLAACNSTEDSNPVKEEETTGSVNEQTNTQNSANDRADTEVDDTVQETTPSNPTIQYEKNGEQKEVVTTMTKSPEQDYEIALAQGFSVEGEEPGRDMLVYDENDQYSMRIEVFAKDETNNYEELAQQTENTVAITAPEGQYTLYELEPLLASHKDILNAAGYVVTYTEDDDQVVTVIFEKESKIVRLTIFDTTAAELTDAFLQMGFTIQ